MNLDIAFRDGWDSGAQARATDGPEDLTPRMVYDMRPAYGAGDVEAFMNGYVDGYAGDTFRLDARATDWRAVTPLSPGEGF